MKQQQVTLTPEIAAKFFDEVSPSLGSRAVMDMAMQNMAETAAEMFDLYVRKVFKALGYQLPEDPEKLQPFFDRHGINLQSTPGKFDLREYAIIIKDIERHRFRVDEIK